MSFQLPKQGFVFWPVGSGDSATIVVNDTTVLQVDLHQLECTQDDKDPRMPVIDRLAKVLPTLGGKPYIAVFVLTHPDQDHCLGFAELLERAVIGELWFSPRVFWEYKTDLCDDAIAFREEAMRRVKKTIANKGNVASSDRIRIIGYSDLLKEDDYQGFPETRLSVPGHTVAELDGTDRNGEFCAFIHAPFKDDSEGERNETSVAMQVTIKNGDTQARAMLLGDLSYPTLRRIFDRSKKEMVAWDVFLAPHHCSKSAMYWRDSDAEEEKLQQDILDDIEAAASKTGYIVASSEPIPGASASGDNPPHARAAARYREIAPAGFLCTQEHGDEDGPEPIVFEVGATGSQYRKPSGTSSAAAKGLRDAVVAARGTTAPPRDRVGFGNVDDRWSKDRT